LHAGKLHDEKCNEIDTYTKKSFASLKKKIAS